MILTDAGFDNAIAAVLALSGSTNAVIHMLALAGRRGNQAHHRSFDQLSKKTPVWLIADQRQVPDGRFYYAGGLPAVLATLKPTPGPELQSITEKHLGKISLTRTLQCRRSFATSTSPSCLGGWPFCAASRSTACDQGCGRRTRLLRHTGPPFVFDSFDK